MSSEKICIYPGEKQYRIFVKCCKMVSYKIVIFVLNFPFSRYFKLEIVRKPV